MKIKILLMFLLSYYSADAQWPVLNGNQGNVTGTIGEKRGNSHPARRIHNGTDIDEAVNEAPVYSVQADRISRIVTNTTAATNHYIEMTSGIRYTHVNIFNTLVPAGQVAAVNSGALIVEVAQGDQIGVMIGSTPDFGSHVHLTNTNNDNFLVNGFGVTGYAFINNVNPVFGPNDDSTAITFYKDRRAGSNVANDKFSKFVVDEGFPAGKRPLILWGPVDIVGNIYRPWIGTSGNLVSNNRSAPHRLGYSVHKLNNGLSQEIFRDNDRLWLRQGFSGSNESGTVDNTEIIDSILSQNAVRGNPFFIVTNKYLGDGSVPKEGHFPTGNHPDGDYRFDVRAEDVKGTAADAVAPFKEKSFIVRFDNYKTFIRRVIITDANSLTKYFAEWESNTAPDGSIFLLDRVSESIKSGQTATIVVSTSEKVPSLQLSMPGRNIAMTASGNTGQEWTTTFTVPSSASGSIQLSFKSGEKIFGLVPNQELADIKRDPTTGNFSDDVSIDKNHQLKVCPESNTLALEVDVIGGQDVTLLGTGGTEPYTYSIDEMPITPQHRSNFSTTTNYTINYDQNYIFKVRDANNCQAERYYTLPRVQCDALTTAGTQGTDIKQINLGNVAGPVEVQWDMYGIPDQISLNYRGNQIFNSGIVSGPGSHSFSHVPATGESNTLTITVFAPNPGTAWEYRVLCPTSARAENVRLHENEFRTEYKDEIISIVDDQVRPGKKYNFQYQITGSNEWIYLYQIQLPYFIKTGGKDVKLKKTKAVSDPSMNLLVYPNPSESEIKLQFSTGTKSKALVFIYDNLGKIIYQKNISVIPGLNIVDLTPDNLNPGVYLIKVIQDKKSITTKLIRH